MAAEPDEETPLTGELPPEGDVFSYSMLAAPEQMKKHKTFTCDAGMSYILVALVLAMQGVMLYCVYNKVVVSNAKWQRGIMRVDEDWGVLEQSDGSCSTGRSLCLISNDTYSCAPPSVQLTGRWNDLDVDGDGIWTMKEVLQTREELKCKYVVDPLEIFSVFQKIILEREKVLWIHPDVKAGKAIHKPYFTYAMGDVAMCGYRNQDMCNNLLKRGVFDAALKYNTAPRVGNSIESALDYCREMLQPMGLCETYLPSTYATWKIESVVQCQEPKYKEFVYENPGSSEKKSLLEVDYFARQKFENAETPIFQVYKGSICGVWILLIISQLRIVWSQLCFILFVKIAKKAGSGEATQEEEEEEDNGMTWPHKIFMILVTCARMGMLCNLCHIGLSFLGKQTDYIGLLLDGIALLFIIDVQEIIYEKVIRPEIRAEWDDSDPLEYKKIGIGYLNKKPQVEDMLWLFVVIIATVIYIRYMTVTMVEPLQHSLDCACRSDGEKCYEAERFSKSFWDHYWRYDVPGVFAQINSLKAKLLLDVPNLSKHWQSIKQ